ncbi:hypothetical protein FHG87_022754 [Trinorchestia longiramus]|nr:hypothetical protein FHG87_022754 [Trinorchestia longiramus]
MADDSRSSDSSDSESSCDGERNQTATSKPGSNVFKNDGSFLEMFKKMQDQKNQEQSESSDICKKEKQEDANDDQSEKTSFSLGEQGSAQSSSSRKSSFLSCVGKRRGGRVLPTGIVKKAKKSQQGEQEGEPNDAWSRYLNEVRKYREQSCEEEGKRRPLVK